MQIPFVKTVLVIVVLFCSGCATSTYKSVETGPRAKVNFISENYINNISSYDTLELWVMEENEVGGGKKRVGEVKLGTKGIETIYMPANKPWAYFVLFYYKSELLGSSTRTADYAFKFRLEDGKEYTIEYVDLDEKFKVLTWEIMSNGKREKVKAYRWGPKK